jgi:oxygen-dependent protoporphyrinogen oxidase
MKAAFGKVWKLEDQGGSIIGAPAPQLTRAQACGHSLHITYTRTGGTIKGLRERSAKPPAPWDADLPKPKGQTVASFRRGLATFPRGLAARLGERVLTSWALTAVARASDGTYTLSYDTPEGPRTVSSRAVIFTLPSHASAPLLRLPAPPVADALDTFYYPPVGAVTVSYPQSAIREDRLALGGGALAGFGQLHPRSQGIVTLGTIYSSALFPNRCPPGQVLLLNYIGGAKNTGIATQPVDEIVAQVDKDLRIMLLRPDAPPPRVLGVRVWPKAIPQFNIGHLDVLCAPPHTHARTARACLPAHALF